jgi:hypothetical protein
VACGLIIAIFLRFSDLVVFELENKKDDLKLTTIDVCLGLLNIIINGACMLT